MSYAAEKRRLHDLVAESLAICSEAHQRLLEEFTAIHADHHLSSEWLTDRLNGLLRLSQSIAANAKRRAEMIARLGVIEEVERRATVTASEAIKN